jgi:hypothetical protein
MEYNFNSSIRGYHVYKNVWKYEIGDKLICEREENNPNDKFSVKLVLQRGNPGQCVGHVPIEFSKIFSYFLRRGGNINVTVMGDKFVNIGLEVPCTYTFSGSNTDIEKLKTLLK